MHYRLAHRFPRDVSGAGLISSRLLVAVAMLFGTMSLGFQGASAQGDPGFEYDQDGLNWAVEYDDSVWTKLSAPEGDFSLESENGSVALFLTLPDLNVDPAGCLDGVIPTFEDGAGITDSTPLEGESGDPIAGDTDAYAYAVQTVESDSISGETVHACFALDGSSLLWVVTLIPDGADDLDATYALYDSVSIDGEATPIGLPDGDASGTPVAGNGTPVAGDATATASDDSGTPVSEDGTPVAGGAGADEDAGTYESHTYGYMLSWDADEWTVESDGEASADYPRDLLQLFNADETSLLYVESSDSDWVDTDECVSTLFEEVSIDTDPDAAVEDPETGDPYEISEDGHSAAAYTSMQGDSDITVLVDCRQDPDSDVIVGFTSISNEIDDYFGVEYPAVEEILDSLEF